MSPIRLVAGMVHASFDRLLFAVRIESGENLIL